MRSESVPASHQTVLVGLGIGQRLRSRLKLLPAGRRLNVRLLKQILSIVPDANVDGPRQGNVMVFVFQDVDRLGEEVI